MAREVLLSADMAHLTRLSRGQLTAPALLSTIALTLSGCRVVGGIFKAGVWVGVIAVVLLLGLLLWGVKAMMSR
ncbi:MAG TPA: hypothetical protein VJV79_36365 [Polyangiaceae bacterium]|nr:hypothetical protein [Polyangiaceae bacterium]